MSSQSGPTPLANRHILDWTMEPVGKLHHDLPSMINADSDSFSDDSVLESEMELTMKVRYVFYPFGLYTYRIYVSI